MFIEIRAMIRKRKKIKKVREDEDIFEKLETQNKALQKIIRKLKTGNDEQNSDNKNNNQ
ncbi:MAG: hypothetical protein LC658_08335 [Bacteroidales bacterium]|nr:hypothetical protein [Bacteroidales bacterium]